MNADNAATCTVLRSAGTAYIGETRHQILAGLIVDRRRPLEIGIDLINVQGPAWWISRRLLDVGLVGRAGLMDVIVKPHWPLHMSVLLRASHPGDQDCTVLLLRSEVRRALALSWLVSDRTAESEWIERSVNGVIARCLGGRRA